MSEDVYTKYIEELAAKFENFKQEAERGERVKASCLRSRKLASELTKDLKNFRQVSLKKQRGELD